MSGCRNNIATIRSQIGNILVATPDGQQIPLKELADISVGNGASFIYRENNSRFIGVQFSVEGRDLASAVEDAMGAGPRKRCSCRRAIGVDWGGEYSEYTASRAQLMAIVPLTLSADFPPALPPLSKLQVPARSRSSGC